MRYEAQLKYLAYRGYYFMVREVGEQPDYDGLYSGWYDPKDAYFVYEDAAEAEAKKWLREKEKEKTFARRVS